MFGILEKISPSELVSNGHIFNHNKVRRPRPKFKVSFYLYFFCFWINIIEINFENIKRKIQIIIFDSCFQLKSRFNFDARAPFIPLLNFPFKYWYVSRPTSTVSSLQYHNKRNRMRKELHDYFVPYVKGNVSTSENLSCMVLHACWCLWYRKI